MDDVRLFAAGGFIFEDRLLEFRQIVETFLAAFSAKHFLVPAFVKDGREDLGDGFPFAVFGKGIDEFDEIGGACAFQRGFLDILPEGFKECAAVFRGVIREEFHAALPDISFRLIDDSPESHVVLADNHAQVAEGVLDFHPSEELRAAVNGVRDFLLEELFLEVPCDVVGAVKERDVLVRDALLMELYDFLCHAVCFLARCLFHEAGDLRPAWPVGNEVLVETVLVLGDEGVCRSKDFRA